MDELLEFFNQFDQIEAEIVRASSSVQHDGNNGENNHESHPSVEIFVVNLVHDLSFGVFSVIYGVSFRLGRGVKKDLGFELLLDDVHVEVRFDLRLEEIDDVLELVLLLLNSLGTRSPLGVFRESIVFFHTLLLLARLHQFLNDFLLASKDVNLSFNSALVFLNLDLFLIKFSLGFISPLLSCSYD